MEVERYKMIYTKLIREDLEDEVPYVLTDIIMEDIVNDYFRILGNDFVKNNENKGKLIINNKKYKLKEFINIKEFKKDKIKIYMILSKELSNISHLIYLKNIMIMIFILILMRIFLIIIVKIVYIKI